MYLQKERGTHEFCELLRGVVDGEAGVVLRQDGDVLAPSRLLLQPPLLQQEYCKTGVLWGNELLRACLLPDLRLASLFEGHQLAAGDRNQPLLPLSYYLST